MYAPWPQKETKEQEAAEAKTEQETKGTKAEENEPEVRPAPLPPHSDSRRLIRTPRPLPISWPRPQIPVPRLQPCAYSR